MTKRLPNGDGKYLDNCLVAADVPIWLLLVME